MTFADDIVFFRETRKPVKEDLEKWKFGLERREMKVSWS